MPNLAEILNQKWPIMPRLRLAYQKLRLPEKESSSHNNFFCGERNGNCIWKYSSHATIRFFMPNFNKLKVTTKNMNKSYLSLPCTPTFLYSSKQKFGGKFLLYFTLEDDAIHDRSMRKIKKQVRRKWTIIRIDPLCPTDPFCPTPR